MMNQIWFSISSYQKQEYSGIHHETFRLFFENVIWLKLILIWKGSWRWFCLTEGDLVRDNRSSFSMQMTQSMYFENMFINLEDEIGYAKNAKLRADRIFKSQNLISSRINNSNKILIYVEFEGNKESIAFIHPIAY